MAQSKWRCPCCGFYTFEKEPNGTFDICPVCFWEDDGNYDFEDINEEYGANGVSLIEARMNFKEYRAFDISLLEHVREPNPNELHGRDWNYPSFNID